MKTPVLKNHKNPFLVSSKELLWFICELGLAKISLPREEAFIASLHENLLTEIDQFQVRLKAKKVASDLILAASYCLCSCLDEMVMNSPLSANYAWSRHSLLSIMHNETWGGERFFTILNYAINHKQRCGELLELIYLLLTFGYRGKFHKQSPQTHNQSLKKLTVYILNNKRPINSDESIIELKREPIINTQKCRKCLRYLTLFFIITGLVGFLLFNYQLRNIEQDSLEKLNIYPKKMNQ